MRIILLKRSIVLSFFNSAVAVNIFKVHPKISIPYEALDD